MEPHSNAHLLKRTGINNAGYSALLFICQVKALAVKSNQGNKISKFMTVYEISGIYFLDSIWIKYINVDTEQVSLTVFSVIHGF